MTQLFPQRTQASGGKKNLCTGTFENMFKSSKCTKTCMLGIFLRLCAVCWPPLSDPCSACLPFWGGLWSPGNIQVHKGHSQQKRVTCSSLSSIVRSRALTASPRSLANLRNIQQTQGTSRWIGASFRAQSTGLRAMWCHQSPGILLQQALGVLTREDSWSTRR